MRGLFDPDRSDPKAVRRIKALMVERLDLLESTTLAVAELRCHESDCPPVETVITAREADGSMRDWRAILRGPAGNARPAQALKRPLRHAEGIKSATCGETTTLPWLNS